MGLLSMAGMVSGLGEGIREAGKTAQAGFIQSGLQENYNEFQLKKQHEQQAYDTGRVDREQAGANKRQELQSKSTIDAATIAHPDRRNEEAVSSSFKALSVMSEQLIKQMAEQSMLNIKPTQDQLDRLTQIQKTQNLVIRHSGNPIQQLKDLSLFGDPEAPVHVEDPLKAQQDAARAAAERKKQGSATPDAKGSLGDGETGKPADRPKSLVEEMVSPMPGIPGEAHWLSPLHDSNVPTRSGDIRDTSALSFKQPVFSVPDVSVEGTPPATPVPLVLLSPREKKQMQELLGYDRAASIETQLANTPLNPAAAAQTQNSVAAPTTESAEVLQAQSDMRREVQRITAETQANKEMQAEKARIEAEQKKSSDSKVPSPNATPFVVDPATGGLLNTASPTPKLETQPAAVPRITLSRTKEAQFQQDYPDMANKFGWKKDPDANVNFDPRAIWKAQPPEKRVDAVPEVRDTPQPVPVITDFGQEAPSATPWVGAAMRIGEITEDEKTQMKDFDKFEAFRSKPYRDANGWAIGYGTQLDKNLSAAERDKLSITKEDANAYAIMDLRRQRAELENYDWFSKLDRGRQNGVAQLAYTMGVGGVLGFPKLIQALKETDNDKIAAEIKNSDWYKQVHATRGDFVIQQLQGRLRS